MRANDLRARGHAGFLAFVAHRVSGIVLALFLPVHFFALSQALSDPRALDGFLESLSQSRATCAEERRLSHAILSEAGA